MATTCNADIIETNRLFVITLRRIDQHILMKQKMNYVIFMLINCLLSEGLNKLSDISTGFCRRFTNQRLETQLREGRLTVWCRWLVWLPYLVQN